MSDLVEAAVAQPANLLLVTFDQWRGDWGDPGRPIIPLPALASLAASGVIASRCYTASPHCVPARFSWLTGLQPSQMGITRNMDATLPLDAPSLVRQLQSHGWHTQLVGKSHWSSHAKAGDLADNQPLLQALGFDQAEEVAGPRALRRMTCGLTRDWQSHGCLEQQRSDLERRYGQGLSPEAWVVRPSLLPPPLYPDVWIAERALQQLAALPTQQPWLLWVSFVGPHEPFDTPPPWAGRHPMADLPAPEVTPAWSGRLPPGCELARLRQRWQGRLSPEDIQACRADYADHLRLLDDQLTRLLKLLSERSDRDQTAVLATADHGELLGDWGALYKGAFLEGAVRVPWVYRPPGGGRPQRWQQPLALTELLAQCWAGLATGGNVAPLHRWAQRQEGAVVEFGDELLIVQGSRKLVLDGNGQPLWASRVEADGADRLEMLRQRPWQWHLNPGWRKLHRKAQREWRLRHSAGWLWRDLNPQG